MEPLRQPVVPKRREFAKLKEHAEKLAKVKQTRLIRAGLLLSEEEDPFRDLGVVIDGDWQPVGGVLHEGACAALVMRWLWWQLSGSDDARFLDSSNISDLGRLQVIYNNVPKTGIAAQPGR